MFKLDQDAHCCQRAAGPGHGASIVAVGLCVFLPVHQLSGCRWTTGVNNRTGCYGCWLLVVRVKVSWVAFCVTPNPSHGEEKHGFLVFATVSPSALVGLQGFTAIEEARLGPVVGVAWRVPIWTALPGQRRYKACQRSVDKELRVPNHQQSPNSTQASTSVFPPSPPIHDCWWPRTWRLKQPIPYPWMKKRKCHTHAERCSRLWVNMFRWKSQYFVCPTIGRAFSASVQQFSRPAFPSIVATMDVEAKTDLSHIHGWRNQNVMLTQSAAGGCV